MFLIRGLLIVVAILGIATCSATVKLGDRTVAQHIQRIWASDETQEMVEGVKREAGPVVDRVKRGVEAGVRGASGRDAGLAGEAERLVDGAEGRIDRAVDRAVDDSAGAVAGRAADRAAAEAREAAARAVGDDGVGPRPGQRPTSKRSPRRASGERTAPAAP